MSLDVPARRYAPAAVLAGAMLSLTVAARADDVLPYHEDEPRPVGYHLESRVRSKAVVAGALLVGVPYAASVAFALALQDRDVQGKGWLLLPIAGPFVSASKTECTARPDRSCGLAGVWVLAFVFDGIAQGAGAIVSTVGLLARKDVWVRDAPAVSWSIVPFGGVGTVGIGAHGIW